MVMFENENLGTRLDNIEQIFVNDEVIPQILKRAGSARKEKGSGGGSLDTLPVSLEKIQAELHRGAGPSPVSRRSSGDDLRPPERGGDSANVSRLNTRE